jgi:uncharacterized membrane protein YheB (UPF0754 family)
MNYWLIAVPFLTAFTGWLVIRIVVKMLFRPLTPRKLIGFSWQGVFPSQKHLIAKKAGEFAAAELTNAGALEEKISDPSHFENVKPLIETHIDDFLRNKLKEQMPMIGMFIGDKTIGTLKTIFIHEIETLFPQVMQKVAGNLKAGMNIEMLVASRIAAIPPEKIETMLYTYMAKEIHKASVLGGLVGLVVGLLQLLIIFLTR